MIFRAGYDLLRRKFLYWFTIHARTAIDNSRKQMFPAVIVHCQLTSNVTAISIYFFNTTRFVAATLLLYLLTKYTPDGRAAVLTVMCLPVNAHL